MSFIKISVPSRVTAIAALGLLAGIALSWPLWNAGARSTFPALPIWGGYLTHTAMTGLWPAVVLIGLTVSSAAMSGRKTLIVSLLVLLSLLCSIDLNRLQPWVWFYMLVFATAIFGIKETEYNTIAAFRWLLAAVYCWGGFNKLSPYFAEDNFPWFCDAFSWSKPAGQYTGLGYLVAALELAIGVALLRRRALPYFRTGVLLFHALIIVFLWKLNWNLVVIPWNIAMAAMVWVLCPAPEISGKQPGDTGRPPTVSLSRLPSPILFGAGVAWITPLLHFFYLWPHSLSWEMYSNTQPEATFFVENGRLNCTREMDEMWSALSFDDHTKLLLDDWAVKELRVPMFATENTFRRIGAYLKQYVCPPPDKPGSSLYILMVHRWDKSAESMIEIPGKDLINK